MGQRSQKSGFANLAQRRMISEPPLLDLIQMKRRRGNPEWGKPIPPAPALLTEFEKQVRQMGLRKHEYAASAELKRWCERNRNRVYVPEWLLREWGMAVEPIFTDVA